MRKNYPILSQELNDKLMSNYETLVYLLGQQTEGYTKYSGVYDILNTTCSGFITSSEIPSMNTNKTIDILKHDYIYRKHFGQVYRS